MRSLYMRMQWNYCDICKIFRIRMHLKWSVFKKISFTKNYKTCLFPSSSFTMKICTNSSHLPDYDRTWVVSSIDIYSIVLWGLVAEKWSSENLLMARKYEWEWRRRRECVVPLSSCNSREIWAISAWFSGTTEKLKGLILQQYQCHWWMAPDPCETC